MAAINREDFRIFYGSNDSEYRVAVFDVVCPQDTYKVQLVVRLSDLNSQVREHRDGYHEEKLYIDKTRCQYPQIASVDPNGWVRRLSKKEYEDLCEYYQSGAPMGRLRERVTRTIQSFFARPRR